eukprot:757438-Pelagomonas_calceolata.AAC.1
MLYTLLRVEGAGAKCTIGAAARASLGGAYRWMDGFGDLFGECIVAALEQLRLMSTSCINIACPAGVGAPQGGSIMASSTNEALSDVHLVYQHCMPCAGVGALRSRCFVAAGEVVQQHGRGGGQQLGPASLAEPS